MPKQLNRQIGLFSAIAIVVANMVGTDLVKCDRTLDERLYHIFDGYMRWSPNNVHEMAISISIPQPL